MTADNTTTITFKSQDEVDLWYSEAKKSWDEAVEKSGVSQGAFIAKDKEAKSILYFFSLIKEAIISEGMECPELAEGVKVIERNDK